MRKKVLIMFFIFSMELFCGQEAKQDLQRFDYGPKLKIRRHTIFSIMSHLEQNRIYRLTQLLPVKGVGEKTIEKLHQYYTVSEYKVFMARIFDEQL